MQNDSNANPLSLRNLIVGMSLCMLSAGWVGGLDLPWFQTWAYSGLFGMVTAVGLGSKALRNEQEKQEDQEQLQWQLRNASVLSRYVRAD